MMMVVVRRDVKVTSVKLSPLKKNWQESSSDVWGEVVMRKGDFWSWWMWMDQRCLSVPDVVLRSRCLNRIWLSKCC